MPSKRKMPSQADVRKILTTVRNANESLEKAYKHSRRTGILSAEKSLETCLSIVRRLIESLETGVSAR